MDELKHVAYLVPHTDVTAEMDCRTMLPGHVIHVQRMWLDEVGERAEQNMLEEEFPMALRYLKGVVPYKCAVFGCTSASAAKGVEGMLELERRMEEELGCPAITALGAVLREIKGRNAQSVAVLTPYTSQVNSFFQDTMERFGVHVGFMAGMGLVSDGEIAALKPAEILAFTQSQREHIPESADLCFFSCTNVRAAEILAPLSECVGRPFISSNQCVINYILSLEG